MAKCEMCGNDYDKSFTVTMDGESHVFDSFECAIKYACAYLQPLRLPDHRARYGER